MNAASIYQAAKIQERIDELAQQRDQLLSSKNGAIQRTTRTGRNPMSEEAREKIRQAQLKRWAKMPKNERSRISREARKRAKA